MERFQQTELYKPDLEALFDVEKVTMIDAGHMMYHKCLVDTAEGTRYFVKTSDDALLTDANEARKMWEYLIKEQYAYDIVGRHGYPNIPGAQLHNRSLVLEAMSEQDGWQWEAPANDRSIEYIEDILTALDSLSKVPAAQEFNQIMDESSPQLLLRKGWGQLDQRAAEATAERSRLFIPDLHEHVNSGVPLINDVLDRHSTRAKIAESMRNYADLPTDYIGHFDARQANIGWHPEQGVKLVDWSWASPGVEKADTTMFLIDLHKSGIDISKYLDDYFDPDHALLLTGYWLAKSGTESYSGDLTVRFHQFASAVAAASLLVK